MVGYIVREVTHYLNETNIFKLKFIKFVLNDE